jgi:diadenosine tetraphosphate (Ap4A) HIT family hydrolase
VSCSYCFPVEEVVLWSGLTCRVILADEPGFDGWCRVIWRAHVRELSDLDDADRNEFMRVVATVERALVAELHPVKMNIAALGTAAPHLHMHVIPRFTDDATFPDPVWTARRHTCSKLDRSKVAETMRSVLSSMEPA